MTDEKKTIKFQIILSEEEAQEIDAWGESRRLRSRAEAIRRLCQIGIKTDRQVDQLIDDMAKVMDSMMGVRDLVFGMEINEEMRASLREMSADFAILSQDIQMISATFTKITAAEDLAELMEMTRRVMRAPKPASS
jgi:hypothetical protein